MKITKQRIAEIIKEEVEGMSILASSMDDLADKIEALDVSIDYLASAMTGKSALSIGATQQPWPRCDPKDAYERRRGNW